VSPSTAEFVHPKTLWIVVSPKPMKGSNFTQFWSQMYLGCAD